VKAVLSELVVTKAVDGTSPLLLQAVAQGRRFTRATLTLSGTSATIVFQLVIPTSLGTTASGADGSAPLEELGLAYGSIRYNATSATGTPIVGSWNQVNNSPDPDIFP
jgi:type VI protein secretion system component Hcp